MRVLIIGGGGREHALAWRAAQAPSVTEVLVAPGNAGTALEPGVRNVDIAANDVAALVGLARSEGVEMTIVGPEEPLVLGVADAFADAGLDCFGPSAAAAQLEGSKDFMKRFLARHNIPTAAFESFDDPGAALRWLRTRSLPIVIKTDGLAAGKGVIIATTFDQAERTIRDMLSGTAFGDAGRRIVIEEFLEGEEASFIAMVDGKNILPLASSQDHKTRDEGDVGPNTGGMGAYSPAPVIDDRTHERIMRDVMRPAVAGMAADGCPYRGFLYAGLMIGAAGAPRVLEFNCRFGDPETQPIMMRLRADLVALCRHGVDGTLDRSSIDWDPRVALGVVMAAGGYPGAYQRGATIHGLAGLDSATTKVFHAGTELVDGRTVTAGGRVLCVVALADNVTDAQRRANQACGKISWQDAYYRRDIGHRAVKREMARVRVTPD